MLPQLQCVGEHTGNSEPPASGRTQWGSIKKPQTTGLVLDGTHPVFRTDFTFLHLGLLACAQTQLGLVRGPQLPSPTALCGSSAGGRWTGTGEAEPRPGWLCGVEDNGEDPPQDKILTRLYSHKSEDWLSYVTASETDRHSMYHVLTTMVFFFFNFLKSRYKNWWCFHNGSYWGVKEIVQGKG